MKREPAIELEEAQEILRRAVELQMATESEKERGDTAALLAAPKDGLSVRQIAEAAMGAGIEPQHVLLAIAERRLPDGELIRRDRWTARWMRRLVEDADVMKASARFAVPPATLLQAFRSVTATPAYNMVLEDSLGEDPLVDGVLVYRLQGDKGWSASSFHSELELADARVLLVTIRAAEGGSLLNVRAPMFRRGLNLALAAGFSGGLGAGASAGGAAAGGAVAAWLGAASLLLTAGPAVVGALAGGALGLSGYRRLHRWARGEGTTALSRLTRAVELEIESMHARAQDSLPPPTP